MYLLATVIVAAVGGLVALRLKIPAGALIGAMVTVTAFNLFTGQALLPSQIKVVTQTVAGGFIGLSMNQDTIKKLRLLVGPALFVAIFMNLQGLLLGLLVYHLTALDLTTAMFAAAPGGIVDMTLVAMDMGADTSSVAVLQTVRLATVIAVFPQIIGPVSARFQMLGQRSDVLDEKKITRKVADMSGADEAKRGEQKSRPTRTVKNSLITLSFAAAGGLLGFYWGIPAGVILFSLVFVAGFNVTTGRAYIPLKLKRAAQMLAGALVGAGIGLDELRHMRTLLLPAVIIIAVYMACNLLAGYLLHRFFGVDWVTGMFASSPAGVSDFALIAADLGAQGPSVAVMHIVRLISIVAFYPQIVRLVLHLFN